MEETEGARYVHGERMSDDILRKIRALLAKAESTTIEAEAETFREAAIRLMSKYQIDEAELVAQGVQTFGRVEARTIKFRQMVGRNLKTALLGKIATLHHGRALDVRPTNKTRYRDGSSGGVILVGERNSMRMVEMLWTSLCLQLDVEATRFVEQHSGRGVHGRQLRLSFVTGWVIRVMERLETLYGEVLESSGADTGTDLVLRDQKTAADDFVSQKIATRNAPDRETLVNNFGYCEGERVGDRADIGQSKVGNGTRTQLPGGAP